MEKKRKYLSEFAVNLYSARWQLITAEQLTSGGKMRPEELGIANSCHIYLICQRPGLTYVPETFSYNDGIISGELTYRISGAKKTIPFQRPFDLLDRGGSGWLDSLGHSLSGAWRVADYAAVRRVIRFSSYTWSGVWPSSA